MNDLGLYLVHILENIDDIGEFTRDGRAVFQDSRQIQAAVKYALQTLAESTQRLPDTVKANYPEINWAAIAGLRNRLVHEYLGIDLGILWDVIENDLGSLRNAIELMLRDYNDQRNSDP